MSRIAVIALICFMVLGGAVFGEGVDNDQLELSEPALLPDSPFYFLVEWGESLGEFLSFNEKAKAEHNLEVAEKRISEARALAEEEKTELVEKGLDRYQEKMDEAMERAMKFQEQEGEDFPEEVIARIAERTLYHQEILEEVSRKVPEEAREAVQMAMEKGMRGHEEATKAVQNAMNDAKRGQGEGAEERMQKLDEAWQGIEKAQERLNELQEKRDDLPKIPKDEGTIPDKEDPEDKDIEEEIDKPEDFQEEIEEEVDFFEDEIPEEAPAF